MEQAIIATDLDGIVTYGIEWPKPCYLWAPSEATVKNIMDLLFDYRWPNRPSDRSHVRREKLDRNFTVDARRKRLNHIRNNAPIYDDQGIMTVVVGTVACILA